MSTRRQMLALLLISISGFACVLIAQSAVLGQEATPSASIGCTAPEPLSLEQAISIALTHNPRVYQAEQDLRAAEAGVTQAQAARSVTADVEVTHTRVSEVATFTVPVPAPPPDYITFESVPVGSEKQTQGTLTVAMPLYTGGRIPAGIRQSRAIASSVSQGSLRTRQTVANDVKQAYYGVMVAASFVEVAEQTLASAREHLRVAQAQYEAGTVPRFDVLRAEARIAESEHGFIQARNGLNLARAALNNAMGVAQDREYQLTTPLAQPPVVVEELPALIAEAEKARPELRQGRAQIDAAEAAADIARAAKHPTLGVAWIYSRVFETSAFQVSNWTLALNAGLNIFDGKQTSAAVARARHEQESARGMLEQVRQGVALQVRQAYLDLESAQERIASASKGVAQAQEAFRIATVRYQAGLGIGVEVIDAEVALAAARNQHAQAVYDYNVALAKLEYAVGARDPAEEMLAPADAPAQTPAP